MATLQELTKVLRMVMNLVGQLDLSTVDLKERFEDKLRGQLLTDGLMEVDITNDESQSVVPMESGVRQKLDFDRKDGQYMVTSAGTRTGAQFPVTDDSAATPLANQNTSYIIKNDQDDSYPP